jgi:hypothetical protein
MADNEGATGFSITHAHARSAGYQVLLIPN